jgi:hypothetical protein
MLKHPQELGFSLGTKTIYRPTLIYSAYAGRLDSRRCLLSGLGLAARLYF